MAAHDNKGRARCVLLEAESLEKPLHKSSLARAELAPQSKDQGVLPPLYPSRKFFTELLRLLRRKALISLRAFLQHKQ